MIQIRKSQDRGFADHGWLKSYHTFSFADYYDSAFMGFGPLLVINEDFIAPGAGFPTHGHKDMEIFTYPISGAVAHKDSTGAEGVIYPYEIQKMSAGSGIKHSEYNHLKNEPTHLLQIWIQPHTKGLKPQYEQKSFKEPIHSYEPTLILSPEGINNSFKIYQDAFVWVKKSQTDHLWNLDLNTERKYWLQVVSGNVKINNTILSAGDAAALTNESAFHFYSATDSEVLFFDMV